MRTYTKAAREKFRKARDYYMACARRAAERARLCDQEDKPDWADFSRDLVRAYVRDARYFNHKVIR